METKLETTSITIEATINALVEKVWEFWTQPEHITLWNFASPDWHSPWAKSDLRVGGKFSSRMEAKDGSFGFEIEGVFTVVNLNKRIEYTMFDNRKAIVVFENQANATRVIETFDAENINSIELQRGGWQAILNNFKEYAEGQF